MIKVIDSIARVYASIKLADDWTTNKALESTGLPTRSVRHATSVMARWGVLKVRPDTYPREYRINTKTTKSATTMRLQIEAVIAAWDKISKDARS